MELVSRAIDPSTASSSIPTKMSTPAQVSPDHPHGPVNSGGDGIDYESGSGGLVRNCTFEQNSDDGIDLDDDVSVVIEHSEIRNNGNDGIEVRLHDYSGPELTVVIRNNRIWVFGRNSPRHVRKQQILCGICNVANGMNNIYEGNFVRAVEVDEEVMVCGIMPGSKDETVKTTSRSSGLSARVRMRRLFTVSSSPEPSISCR